MKQPESTKNKIEVLAPAGGPEALRAAVYAGADAVYLGGPAFGARASAQNFSREELREAAAFCRARGVRVHVTVNTLLRDDEVPQAMEFVEFLCSLPVDAVLVQDMGLFSLLRERAPALPIHCSTQMSLHTPAGVRLLYGLGASRVVLAREMSLGEIEEAARACPVELESFVHGALCMSVSGQCYFSALLGGRSGNRGMCAQTCRLPFSASGGTGHDLSLKDLSFIPQVRELEKAGVCSAKIEGRMKRPEYVAAAVSACRRAVDGEEVPPDLLEKLEAVFSRSGFTQGYLTGKRGRAMFGVRTKEDVAGATGKVFAALRGLYRGERQRVPVAMELSVSGDSLTLTARDEEGHTAVESAPLAGDAAPLPQARAVGQLQKAGGTPFLVKEAQAPEGVPVTVAGVNALRRQALESLLRMRAETPPIPMETAPLAPAPRQARGLDGTGGRDGSGKAGPSLRAAFRSVGQVCPEAKNLQALLLPLETGVGELESLREKGFPPVFLELPRAMFGQEDAVRREMQAKMEKGFTDFTCGNLGAVALCRELGAAAHGSFSLNITNTWALEFFKNLGLVDAELSFELSGRDAAAIGGSLPRGVMAYGRQAAMLTRNCPLANSPKGCLGCKTPGALTDRMGKKFPVICRKGGRWGIEVLNSVPLWLGGMPLAGADFAVFRFTVEGPGQCGAVLSAFAQGGDIPGIYTRGLWRRGVE